MSKEELLKLAMLAKEELVSGNFHDALDYLYDIIDVINEDLKENKN